MRHTPKPWESTHGSDPTGYHDIAGVKGTPLIARVLGCGSAVGEANACLLVAAPELLEALIPLVELYWNRDFISCVTPGARKDATKKPSSQRIFDMWDQAKAAIAKAKGAQGQ